MLTSYRELIVWQKAIDLAVEVYRVTRLFPREELYGMTSQMRRAAVSVSANIAEGFTRKHRQEYAQFIRIAFGSGAELESLITVATAIQLVPAGEFKKVKELLTETMRMLNALAAKLHQS